MNKTIMSGRLTKDPEVRFAAGKDGQQTAIAHFSVAVDRKIKRPNEPEADFWDCTSFGKQAEFIQKYFKKGSKILLEGRFQNDNYTNKDGQKVYRTVFICETVEFGDSAPKTGENGGGNAPQVQAAAPQVSQAPAANEFTEMPFGDDDGLPFG